MALRDHPIAKVFVNNSNNMKRIVYLISFCLLLTCCKSTVVSNKPVDLDYPVNDTLSRLEFLADVPIQKQAGFARANFAPAVQAQLWMTKIEDTMSSPDLSDAEKDVIKKLVPCITESTFAGDRSELAEISDEVGSILVEQYGWDEEKLFVYLSTFYTVEEYRRMTSE